MPFEVAPIEAPVRIGPYKGFADAMLEGCKKSYPIRRLIFNGSGGACALGALYLGMGAEPHGDLLPFAQQASSMEMAYVGHYGNTLTADNDGGTYTREQIAARIAAL